MNMAWHEIPVLAAIAAAISVAVPGGGVTLAQTPVADAQVGSLSTLRRVVKRFDFNESPGSGETLPLPFYRYIAPSEGFPPFGTIRLTASDAFPARAADQGSLLFDLGGGSMSARVPTSIIPAVPLSDYLVTARVKTVGLRHAHACVVAWIHDVQGQIIPASRTQSRLLNTDGKWDQVTLQIPGHWPAAADIALELQVIQPLLAPKATKAAQPEAPRLTDTQGKVWFDDVIVAHMPRITLAMVPPINLVQQPHQPRLLVAVNELASEPLHARLRVLDLDGKPVYDSTFPAPRGQHHGTIQIPPQPCGWYRAILDISGVNSIPRRQWLDFVVLPEETRQRSAPASLLGIRLPPLTIAAAEVAPQWAEWLAVSNISASAWSQSFGPGDEDALQTARFAMIDQLIGRDFEVTLAIDTVPDTVAKSMNLESFDVLPMIRREPRLWRGYLDAMLVNFGLEVRRWQFGSLHHFEAFDAEGLDQVINAARLAFSDFVPDPDVFTTWSAEQSPPQNQVRPACTVVMPWQVQGSAVETYTKAWKAATAELHLALRTLPAPLASPRRRVGDTLIRALHAWRGGASLISIDAPWTSNDDQQGGVMPDALFAAWRNLNRQLAGRTIVGEMPLSDGQHCWILRGNSSADSALVAWSDTAHPNHAGTFLSAPLADGAVTVTDAFGNADRLPPREGVHSVRLGDLPVFIENVNAELVQFRGSLGVEPNFVPAIAKVQEHQIVLTNPWAIAISGTVTLLPDDEWQLSPSTLDFAIKPGGETRLPFTIVPNRSILAGSKTIRADVSLNAEKPYRLAMDADLTVGLPNIDLAASYSLVDNPRTGQVDLMVTQAVTNKGDTPMNLDVHMLADGVGQNRRTIPALGPAETAIRTFRVPNGGVTLLGKVVRVGVSERDGLTRLNQLLTITGRAVAGVGERAR